MTAPSAFCTLATAPCRHELVGFLYSLSIHHPGAVVFVEADTATRNAILELALPPRLDLRIRATLDIYSSRNRTAMTKDGSWAAFQMAKADAIDAALAEFPDALFLDSDILVTAPLEVPAPHTAKILGVSPGYIPAKTAQKVGFYNGGMLWVKKSGGTPSLTKLWRQFTRTSRYYDQASIEDLVRVVGVAGTHVFGPEYNLQGYRWTLNGHDAILRHLAAGQGCILWDGKPLRFIHTHFDRKQFAASNSALMRLMERAGMAAHLLIVERIVRRSWLVLVPGQPCARPQFKHTDDSFRELARMWSLDAAERAGNDAAAEVVVRIAPGEVHCWLGARKHILLFDRPGTKVWADETARTRPLKTLVGNTGLKELPAALPWIFWPRRPLHVAQFLAAVPPAALDQPRARQIVFIAGFQVDKQVRARRMVLDDPGWKAQVDDWYAIGAKAGASASPRLSTRAYIARIAASRFGICVAGYGPKCHREVELMAVGTVPIILPGVDIENYAEPPKEGVHYMRARSPRDLAPIKRMAHDDWVRMSRACRDWYARNISPQGSLRRTLELAIYGTAESEN
jgi:hypothetical protein